MKKITLLTLVMLLALPALAATRTVDESREAASDAEIQIALISGSVRVVGWDRNEVHIEGTINDKWERLWITGDEDGLDIEVSPPEGRHNNVKLEADLTVHVPSGVELTIESVSGPLSVKGLSGTVSIESVSGDIVIGGGLQELEIESISGTIEIESDPSLTSVDAEVVSGKIEMRGELSTSGEYSLSAVSGRITLTVPEGTSAEYDIETFSGNIDNDFGPRPDKGGLLSGTSLSFSVGSGSAEVEIETFSGSVRLREY